MLEFMTENFKMSEFFVHTNMFNLQGFWKTPLFHIPLSMNDLPVKFWHLERTSIIIQGFVWNFLRHWVRYIKFCQYPFSPINWWIWMSLNIDKNSLNLRNNETLWKKAWESNTGCPKKSPLKECSSILA